MPSNIQPTTFDHVHSVVDTNYIQWPICNTCANEHWKTSIFCICGQICHESDMIQLGSARITELVNKKSNIVCWNILNVFAPSNDDHNILLVVNKLCRKCATLSGSPTTKGREAFYNLLNDSCWDFHNHPLSHLNITHFDNVNSSETKVYPSASIVSYIKNQNPGKIGYAVQYDQIPNILK